MKVVALIVLSLPVEFFAAIRFFDPLVVCFVVSVVMLVSVVVAFFTL